MKNSKKKNQRKTEETPQMPSFIDTNVRFIVPMPGKSSWYSSKQELTYKKIHPYKAITADFALEDYQAQFLMQREYLID
jgi:hypothetical protein